MKLDFKNRASIYFLLARPILKDKRFFILSMSYTCLIAILYLALPLSIEALIGTITATASIQPIVIVSIMLFFLLLLSGVLTLLQKYLIEIYYRASFVRLASDLFLKVLYANKKLFEKFNTSDLNGRYFEIFSIQKSVSALLIEGLLILLQLLVSVILVSFYHPYLFLLNTIFIVSLTLIWRLFFNKAIAGAINKSHAKFHVFSWLHDLFRLNKVFKSTVNKNFALNKAKRLMEFYIQKRMQYWNITLKQNILLVILYLFMTMALFSIGGFLVIKGQLSLGQLVAAEIIFTGVLYSISKLGYYFDLFYNLVASAEELHDVFSIDDEELSEFMVNDSNIKINTPLLVFKEVSYDDHKGNIARFNLTICHGKAHVLFFETNYLREIFIELIHNYIEPQHGLIQLNQVNISLYNQQSLRGQFFIIDDSNIFSCTIREFLLLDDQNFDHELLQMILDLVGLDKFISNYSQELNTAIIGTGYPLSSVEIVLLKLARALILTPKILIITEIIDLIPPEIRSRVIHYIISKKEITLLHFSPHITPEFCSYDKFIYMSRSTQVESENLNEYKSILSSLMRKEK
jgi:putative ABC transport system ATP-binding protein